MVRESVVLLSILHLTRFVGFFVAAIFHFGRTVRVRHVNTGHVLHSHAINYRGGSGQQEVTCFAHRDGNDFFIVEHLPSQPRGGRVPDGSQIRLRHEATGRYLHSHGGIGSPCTGQQEVTCYGGNDSNDYWGLEVADGGNKYFRLIHCNTNHALHSHGGHYFNGHRQQEVTGYGGRDSNDLWVVE
jgi:dolichyl-phosphate-mannose--protein O-mannosyl transferase